jgi:tetrahedral aminopeptidase
MPTDHGDLLRRLTEASGVSGHEIEIGRLVRATFAPLADTLTEDALGNLIALRRGRLGPGAPAVLLAGHMDEIGLMVTALEDGFLRFTGVGGWDPRGLLAQPVWVHGRSPLPGVIGARPPHVLPPEEQAKALPMDDLFIDVGRPAEELAQLVRVGDVVTMRRSTTQLAGSRWTGKAMDNRASLAAMAVALETLQGLRHAWDVYAVATVQEEVGLKGAATAAFGLHPTVAIAVDVGFAKQPGANDLAYALDGGPLIALGPNIHPRVYEALVAAADALEMAYQVEPVTGPTGTDAGAMQVAGAGLPCGLVGIPLRYMHSTVETLSLKDVQRVGRLLAHFVAGLDSRFVESLVEDAGDWDAVPGEHRP